MDIKKISRSFKDISLSFEPHPVTKDLPILKNENAIKRSVRNLTETMFTERFFNSLIGTGVRSTLFEFVDYGSASSIGLSKYKFFSKNSNKSSKKMVN